LNRDKFTVLCPICDSKSILIRNPGVSFYISKVGCNHRKELFGMVKKYHKAQRIGVMIQKRYTDADRLFREIRSLSAEFQQIADELSGKLMGPTELVVGEWRKAKL